MSFEKLTFDALSLEQMKKTYLNNKFFEKRGFLFSVLRINFILQ